MVYAIIVGGGGVGIAVANMLIRHGYLVTIIERDEKRAEELHHLTKANIIVGDATNPRILEEAEIRKANYFITVTGDDKTNVISSILAHHYHVENIITRVVTPAYRDICMRIGLTNIVNPAETVAIQIDALIRGIKFIDFVRVSGEDVDVEELYIRSDNYAGKPIGYICENSKDEIHPMILFRGDEILIPRKDVELKAGDKLLILRKRKKLFFNKFLSKKFIIR